MGTQAEAAKAGEALARQVAALEKAAENAGAAVAHAGKTVGDAQRAGFARVAEGADDLRGRSEKLAALLSTVVGQVRPAQEAVAEVSGESDPEQAITKLSAAVSAVDTARASMVDAAQQARDLENRAAQVLRGAQPGPLIGMFAGVRDTAKQAADHGQTAKQHAQQGIEQGRQISAGGSGN